MKMLYSCITMKKCLMITEETVPPGDPAGGDNPIDTSKYNRTAFVSNLTFSVDEDKIGQIFAEVGILNIQC